MPSPTLFDDFFEESSSKQKDTLAQKRKKAKDEINKLKDTTPNPSSQDLFDLGADKLPVTVSEKMPRPTLHQGDSGEVILEEETHKSNTKIFLELPTVEIKENNISTEESITDSQSHSKEQNDTKVETNTEEESHSIDNNYSTEESNLEEEKITKEERINEIESITEVENEHFSENEKEEISNNHQDTSTLDTLAFQYHTELDYFDRKEIDPLTYGNKKTTEASLVEENLPTSNPKEHPSAKIIFPKKEEINPTEKTDSDFDWESNEEEHVSEEEHSKLEIQETSSLITKEEEAPKQDTPTTSLPEWQLEDKYYHIGAVAKLFGVNVSHIRFWCNEFNMKTRTTKKGTRLFTKAQVEELRKIHYLVKDKKYTIKGAKEQLKNKPSNVQANLTLKEKLESLKSQLLTIKEKLNNE